MSSEALAIQALRSAADKYETNEVDWFGNGKPSSFGLSDLIPRRCAVMTIGSEVYAATGPIFSHEEIMAVADVAYAAMAATLPAPHRNLYADQGDQNVIIAWNDRGVQGGVQTVIAKLREAADHLEAQS